MVTTLKPEVTTAVSEMIPLLRTMNTSNIDEVYQRINAIRKSLSSEQDELTVVSTLIVIGEI